MSPMVTYRLIPAIQTKMICRYFSWDPKKPIICVYASKWFDTPHAYGMKNFIDFHDWISATIDRINNINDAQWLLKPHPCDLGTVV